MKKEKTRKPGKIKSALNKARNVETKPNYMADLQFLDNMVALSPVSRQAHVQAQQALRSLSGAVMELDKLKEAKPA